MGTTITRNQLLGDERIQGIAADFRVNGVTAQDLDQHEQREPGVVGALYRSGRRGGPSTAADADIAGAVRHLAYDAPRPVYTLERDSRSPEGGAAQLVLDAATDLELVLQVRKHVAARVGITRQMLVAHGDHMGVVVRDQHGQIQAVYTVLDAE